MGQNLILNMNDHGYKVVAFNRTLEKVDHFLANEAKGTQVIGAHSLGEMIAALKRPRRVMLMVKAGEPVDHMINELIPHLDAGDIIIDGGNSLFTDTERRVRLTSDAGLRYIGTGISGGEEGARHGPSIMPGGTPEAWPHVKDIFQAIAAKTPEGEPCCDWVGEGGAGHYVKMVHNGIEYGDMQIIAESYQLLQSLAGENTEEMAQTFAEWNKSELDSYLIGITADILAYKEDGEPLVDKIQDTAGQKGTGKWTVMNAAELGQPVTLISEALFARFVSALKQERLAASKVLRGPQASEPNPRLAADIRHALYASKIVSYAQGFMLMRTAAAEYGWNLNFGAVANLWRGGCIIRSRFLADIARAYEAKPSLANLMLDGFFTSALADAQTPWRTVVASAVTAGLPVPAMSSALAFYDAYRSGRLPANLIQAQRDYFGAHTYERTDRPAGEFFHTNWTGTGGTVSSSTYNA
jgi:6-phosphogluconate dehydrogenase